MNFASADGCAGLRRAMCALPVPEAFSQGKYPSRPVRIIVPLPPGGAIDVFARAMGKEFEARTGASVVVENRAGANTICGQRLQDRRT